MDAIDILGGLFGRKKGGSSGEGPDLGDIFGRARQPAPSGQSSSRSTDPRDVDAQAKELEDILNVGREREASRTSQRAPQSTPRQSPPPQSRPSGSGIPVDSPFSQRSRGTSPQNDQALALVRAMINAAKADGQISTAEQQAIISHFEGATDDAMQFLRSELAQPLDVREFVWSVPIGMEQQVYAMSLIAIDVDTSAERSYLSELAHALQLPGEIVEQLERRFARSASR